MLRVHHTTEKITSTQHSQRSRWRNWVYRSEVNNKKDLYDGYRDHALQPKGTV